MSALINQIIGTLKETRPIFFLSSMGNGLYPEPVERGISIDDSEDALTRLVKMVALNTERFDPGRGRHVFNRHDIVSQCMSNVLSLIRNFYFRNSGYKKPTQTNTYKWLDKINPRYSSHNARLDDGLVMLYKYISQFANGSGEIDFSYDDVQDHKSNALAIIELLREKYEQ